MIVFNDCLLFRFKGSHSIFLRQLCLRLVRTIADAYEIKALLRGQSKDVNKNILSQTLLYNHENQSRLALSKGLSSFRRDIRLVIRQ
jgi:hypothetical protein